MAGPRKTTALGPIPAVLVRRNRFCAAIVVVLVAVTAFLGWSGGASGGSAVGDAIGALLGLGTLALVPAAGWLAYYRPRRHELAVSVDDRGLRLRRGVGEKHLVLHHDEATSGDARPLPDGRFRVDLFARFRPRVRLEVETETDARAILGALGLDRRTGTSAFDVHSYPYLQGFGWLSALLVGLLAVAFVGVFPAATIVGLLGALAMPILDRAVFRVSLVVGTDGVEIRRGLGGRRFIPHARIAAVRQIVSTSMWTMSVVSPGFRIELDDGSFFSFDTRGERFRTGVWRTDPIAEAVTRAWETSRANVGLHGSGGAVAAALLRGDRSTTEWVAALRAVGTNEKQAHYRVAAIDERALFEVVGDASASTELRAAAAVALSADPACAPKLRVLADDIAEPAVRRLAMRATDAAEPDAIEEALEEATARRA